MEKKVKTLKTGTDVSFEILADGKKMEKYGSVYIVDRHGTFECPGKVSYDVMCNDENTLYKHLGSDVTPIRHRKGFKNKWNNVHRRKPKDKEEIIVLLRVINIEDNKFDTRFDTKALVYDKHEGFTNMEVRTENESITPVAWIPFPKLSDELRIKENIKLK